MTEAEITQLEKVVLARYGIDSLAYQIDLTETPKVSLGIPVNCFSANSINVIHPAGPILQLRYLSDMRWADYLRRVWMIKSLRVQPVGGPAQQVTVPHDPEPTRWQLFEPLLGEIEDGTEIQLQLIDWYDEEHYTIPMTVGRDIYLNLSMVIDGEEKIIIPVPAKPPCPPGKRPVGIGERKKRKLDLK